MKYDKDLICITEQLASSPTMYSIVCLRASRLNISLCGTRCYLDGFYMLCLTPDDTVDVINGSCEAITLHFLPYFYNVNLNHNVIGLPMYEEMRSQYGYPDFHLFRRRDESYQGILPLGEEEYDMTRLNLQSIMQRIDEHDVNRNWSCQARSGMISILRIAEGAFLGIHPDPGHDILRYIRDHIGDEISIPLLCRQFHTNRTSLARTIKALTGMAPMQYVLEERLNQSRPDLLFTWIPVQEIAEKHGFSDPNYYIRAFKKRFGKSPLQYRTEGRAERIRNESIYHRREADMMKITDFADYLEHGLGRAILQLRAEPDKSPYRQPLITFLTRTEMHPYRAFGVYEKELIECFDDSQALAAEVAGSLLGAIQKGERMSSIPLLLLLGYRDAVTGILEYLYRSAYTELLEFTRQNNVGECHPPCARRYAAAAAAFGRFMQDRDRFKRILLDIADLYDYCEHPVVPNAINPLPRAMDDCMGKQALFDLLDEVEAEHRNGKKLALDIRWEPPVKQVAPDPSIAPERIISTHPFPANQGGPAFFWRSFAAAPETTVRRVAEHMLEERDLSVLSRLSSYFNNFAVKPPEFPLDPTPIIERLKAVPYPAAGEKPEDAVCCICAFLGRVHHPAVKAFGRAILADSEAPDDLRYHALRMCWGVNYAPEDQDEFAAYFRTAPRSEYVMMLDLLIEMIDRSTPGVPEESILYAYTSATPPERLWLIESLIPAGRMTEEMRNECCFDSSPYIRAIAVQSLSLHR